MVTQSDQPTGERFDLLLKGGHVIDPANGRDGVMDVAIAGGRIAAVERDLAPEQAEQVVDVTGLYVTPGLIDMHVHVYPQHFDISVVADAQSFSSGITTMVDAGSAGAANFSDFVEQVVNRSKTRVLAFCNVVNLGMGGDFEQDVARMIPESAAETVCAYPDVAVGVKLAHYWTWQPWDATHAPWDNVERAVAAGELCSKPVMVDFWPRPPERSYEDLLLQKLRPGDIHTHVFAQQFPIVNELGRPNELLFEARKRGIIFDLGHGAGSFWFRQAAPALEHGFCPDSISTDLHTGNAANGLVTNLLNAMSKLRNLGLSVQELVERVTVAPAREIGHPELGTLRVGAEADVTVLEEQQGRFAYIDCGRARMTGTRRLACRLTLRAGDVVYDPEGLTMPEWPDAPEAYWVCRAPAGAPVDWAPPVHPSLG